MYLDVPFIPQLLVGTASTTLYFLVPSRVAYMNRTDDPWFSATTTSQRAGGYYIPDEPAAVLGCISERTFCNSELPASEGCLNLFVSGESEFRRIFPDPKHRRFLRPLSVVLQQYGAGGMYTFFTAKSVPNLLARQTLQPYSPRNIYTALQTKVLPSNQWQKEMEYIGQATLAAMQHFLVEFARGIWLGSQNYLCDEEPCRRTCHSQVC
jgi:hypothetical protein